MLPALGDVVASTCGSPSASGDDRLRLGGAAGSFDGFLEEGFGPLPFAVDALDHDEGRPGGRGSTKGDKQRAIGKGGGRRHRGRRAAELATPGGHSLFGPGGGLDLQRELATGREIEAGGDAPWCGGGWLGGKLAHGRTKNGRRLAVGGPQGSGGRAGQDQGNGTVNQAARLAGFHAVIHVHACAAAQAERGA
jgi:hypothetical protein